MIGTGVFLFCVVMTILIAQFNPLVGLLISVVLCVSEVICLWMEKREDKRVKEIS